MSKIDFRSLQLAKGFKVRIGPNGALYGSLSQSGGEFYLAPEVLLLLQTIAAQEKKGELASILKIRAQEVLEHLPSPGEIQDLLPDLLNAGLLVSKNNAQQLLPEDGFGDPWIQWAMLADETRCLAYEKALQKAVKPGDVVVDVGAGAGFLTACALAAGAGVVHAIEETASHKAIEQVARAAAPEAKGKVIVHSCNSQDAELPEKVHVIVSELFGNDPLQEGVLHTLAEMGSRFHGQKVTWLPEKVEIFYEIVHLKSGAVFQRVQQWQKSYGQKGNLETGTLARVQGAVLKKLDFQNVSFSSWLAPSDFERVDTPRRSHLIPLNPPALGEIPPMRDEILAPKGADCPVLLLWYRVHVGFGVTLSSHPHEPDWAHHWSPLIVPLRDCPAGGHLGVKIQIAEEGHRVQAQVTTAHGLLGRRE